MKILQRTFIQSKLLVINSVSRLSTDYGGLNNQFTKFGNILKKSEIISSHHHTLSPNFFNQFHLENSRKFSSTSSRLGLNNNQDTNTKSDEKKSDENEEYIHMYHKTTGFVGYHTPKPKKWKKHKEKDNDIRMALAISLLGGFALFSIGGWSARAE